MTEMLSSLAALGGALVGELQASTSAASGVNTPRIAYALEVVATRRLPATSPGDLAATGRSTSRDGS